MPDIKVIKISRLGAHGQRPVIPKYNNLLAVNDALAKARDLTTCIDKPRRRAYQEMIIYLSRTRYRDDMDSAVPISKKDIRRLERPGRGKIPVNIFDILEIIVRELAVEGQLEHSKFEYPNLERCDTIISEYLVRNSIALVTALWNTILLIEADAAGEHPPVENLKYRDAAAYVLSRLEDFDNRHPGYFSSLFK